jgi:hypothetical protein
MKIKVLYKVIANGVTFFEYTNEDQQELFNVRFTVGPNNGNYVVNTATIRVLSIELNKRNP